MRPTISQHEAKQEGGGLKIAAAKVLWIYKVSARMGRCPALKEHRFFFNELL